VQHTVLVNAGLGNSLFVIGPRLDLRTTISGALGSDLGISKCTASSLSFDIQPSVGYTIWEKIVRPINFILGLLSAAIAICVRTVRLEHVRQGV
jgi:hypothetical protein